MNKALAKSYGEMNLAAWREFTNIVRLANFKQMEVVRFGGYHNLPAVGQGAPYLPLTSPTDEKAIYTPAKRGGTEDLTREMMLADDVGAVRDIPRRLARAAAQTLHEFIFDLINPAINGTIYDSVALYHANHNNTATAALDATSLAAARLRMRRQTEKDNAKPIGLRPKYLLISPDLEKTAYELTTASYGQYNQVPAFMQQVGLSVLVVDYWTDATNWALVADRMDVAGVEIGFINGQEEPEVFISQDDNVGSMFSNDKLTFKFRHEYGGAVCDYRAFDGSIVAG
jgi:hypothetical protein